MVRQLCVTMRAGRELYVRGSQFPGFTSNLRQPALVNADRVLLRHIVDVILQIFLGPLGAKLAHERIPHFVERARRYVLRFLITLKICNPSVSRRGAESVFLGIASARSRMTLGIFVSDTQPISPARLGRYRHRRSAPRAIAARSAFGSLRASTMTVSFFAALSIAAWSASGASAMRTCQI